MNCVKRSLVPMALIGLVGTAVSGCDSKGGEQAVASASAIPTVAAAKIGELCAKLCDRDVACAGEAAKEAAKSAGLEDVAEQAAEKAVAKAQAGLQACKDDCVTQAAAGAAAGKAQAKAVEDCVAAADCAAYAACVDEVSGSESTGASP